MKNIPHFVKNLFHLDYILFNKGILLKNIIAVTLVNNVPVIQVRLKL